MMELYHQWKEHAEEMRKLAEDLDIDSEIRKCLISKAQAYEQCSAELLVYFTERMHQ